MPLDNFPSETPRPSRDWEEPQTVQDLVEELRQTPRPSWFQQIIKKASRLQARMGLHF